MTHDHSLVVGLRSLIMTTPSRVELDMYISVDWLAIFSAVLVDNVIPTETPDNTTNIRDYTTTRVSCLTIGALRSVYPCGTTLPEI